jgi:hypothetical protein
MNTTIDPEISEISEAVRQALLEIRIYQSSHPVGEMRIKSVEALVASRALSPQTAARIGSYQIKFLGFPVRISQEIAVLDVLVPDRAPSVHFIGFADGHAELVE